MIHRQDVVVVVVFVGPHQVVEVVAPRRLGQRQAFFRGGDATGKNGSVGGKGWGFAVGSIRCFSFRWFWSSLHFFCTIRWLFVPGIVRCVRRPWWRTIVAGGERMARCDDVVVAFVAQEASRIAIADVLECSMEKYVQDAVNQFETQTSTILSEYLTPAVPGSSQIKLEEGKESINMSEYRQHVGRLLYAVTKVIPDCANAIRDLTCHLSTLGEEHWKALTRIMGYLKHHYKPLKMRAPTELRVVAMFDADWATDKNDRKSISSYVTTIGGTSLTNYQLKKQQTVALRSCEAETMAGTLCAQDVLFTRNLLQELSNVDVWSEQIYLVPPIINVLGFLTNDAPNAIATSIIES